MPDDIIEVWGITDQLDAQRMLDPPRPVHHSTRGPICPTCERLNCSQFCGANGILRCQHCGNRAGWMAGPCEGGFLWSTWPLLGEESEGE